jgi:hypothetical protein
VVLPLQLATDRHFEVQLSDNRVDLSKARRVEPRIATLSPPPPPVGNGPAPVERKGKIEAVSTRVGIRVDPGAPKP